MKIAIIVKEHDESRGGLERYAVTLSRGMAGRGHEVHVFANRFVKEDGIIFHYVPYVHWSSLLKVISFPRNVRKHLNKDSFDLVYSHTPLYPLDIYRVGEGLHLDVLRELYPFFLSRLKRYLNPKHLLILWMERRLFTPGNFRAIITNSKLIKKRLTEVYNVKPSLVEVIYNGYDEKLFNPRSRVFRDEIRREYGLEKDEKLLLFVANDFKRKGLAQLLEALNILKKNGLAVRLMIVGKGKIKRYKKLALKLGLADMVVFTGPVREIERYYGTADIFVLPTFYDTFSCACLEAFGSGLPVITTSKAGFSELIDEGENGFVLSDPRCAATLAERITELLKMDTAPELALKKARQFTIEKNVSKTLALCRSIIDDKEPLDYKRKRL